MSRYIEVDALLINQREGLAGEEEIWMVEDINSAPSIDIVRCKECKYASDNKVYGCMLNHFNFNDGYHRMYADDFCSLGERKERE